MDPLIHPPDLTSRSTPSTSSSNLKSNQLILQIKKPSAMTKLKVSRPRPFSEA